MPRVYSITDAKLADAQLAFVRQDGAVRYRVMLVTDDGMKFGFEELLSDAIAAGAITAAERGALLAAARKLLERARMRMGLDG